MAKKVTMTLREDEFKWLRRWAPELGVGWGVRMPGVGRRAIDRIVRAIEDGNFDTDEGD